MLELGPAGGYFTRHLKESLHCVVDAVEIDDEMAEKARPWCRRLVLDDLESVTLTELFEKNSYDIIILADVLEHLRFPDHVLRQLPSLLKHGGSCLISVPNIAYGGLIAGLLEGQFDYRNEGLLDRTHLRFFTQRSLSALLSETGWYPWDWQSVDRAFFDSEFRTRLETLPTEITTFLNSRPVLQCYQWLVKAKLDAPEIPPTLPEKEFSECFPIRAFWAAEGEEFDYSRSQVVWGNLGVERQTIHFSLPKGAQASRLRLRLADRPGFVRLHSIALFGGSGETIWRWVTDFGHLALGRDLSEMNCINADGYTLATLNSPESWLDLPWVKGEGVVPVLLTLDLGWPMSADFEIARRGWENAIIPLRQKINAIKALVATRDVELATRDAAISDLNRILAEKILGQEQLVNNLAVQRDALEAQIQANISQRAQITTQAAQITTLNAEVARMRSFSWWARRFFYWPGRVVYRLRNL